MSNTPTRQKNDWYPTPPEATLKLLEVEPFHGVIWEPAAGDGALCEVLREAGHSVIASDLNEYGYCKAGVDFLMETKLPEVHGPVTNLITNPPYKLAEQFIQKAIDLGVRKHAWLLRLAFLEGAARHESLFKHNPPSRVHVFSKRLTIWRGDERPNDKTIGGKEPRGTTAYAWFVWDQPIGKLRLKPRINWI